MRSTSLRTFAFTIFALALMLMNVPATVAQSLRGNGNVSTQKRSVSGIRGIDVSGGFIVELTQGSNEGVRLEAEENLLNNIKTEVRDGILHIYNEESVNSSKGMKAFVTLEKLESVDISGGVRVIGTSMFKTPELKLDMSGGSNVKLTVDTKQLKADMSGASKVELMGNADVLLMELTGASKVDAAELKAENVKVSANGASNVKVFASKALDIDASGASSVYYKGTPSITSDVSAAARVAKL